MADNLGVLLLNDFSGGFTDNLVDNASNKFATIDNLLINSNRKAYQRLGSEMYDSTHHTVLASGNPRTGSLVNFDNSSILFVQIGVNVFHNPGSWAALLGPSSNACFNTGASNYASFSEWSKHLFACNDAYSYPSKIFTDSGGTTRLRTAGLPKLDLFAACALANDIKSKYNLHRVDSTGANRHVVDDTFNGISSANAVDLTTLITLVSEMIVDYDNHQHNVGGGFHGSTIATETVFTTVAPRTLTECIERLDDLRIKYVAHEANATPHNAIGTQAAHQISVSRSFSFSPSAAGNNYLYAFVYVYEYTVGNLKYVDFGPTKVVAFTKAAAITAASPVTISNWAPFQMANSTIFNWDTATITIRVYRTINNGDTFYWVEDQVDTTVTNTRVGYILNSAIGGATTYVDGATDAIIQAANKQLYINGGVLDNDQPPPAKFVHITDNFAYYGNIREGLDTIPNRVVQSAKFDPDSVPAGNFIDLEDEVVGISSFNSIPIVFCKRFVYRLDGSYDDLGRGVIQALKIINAPGCVGNQSIVQGAEGVFYAGVDGFYWTDGYNIQKLSDDWNTTYRQLTNTTTKQLRIYGCYEEQDRKVHWGVTYADASSDNDKIFTLDLRYGIKRDACFTTWSGSDSFSPTALAVYNKVLVRGDRRGYLFKHTTTNKSDPKINTSVTPSSWSTQYIPFDLTTIHTDFGMQKERKFVPRLTFIAKNRSNLSLQITSYNDQGRSTLDLKEVRFRGNVAWGDELLTWGDSSILWGQDGEIAVWMRFPASQLRLQHKQLQFTNAYTIITNSDTLGTATCDNAANTITLDNAAATWPSNSVNYFISTEVDNYGTEFLVTAINGPTNTVLTLQDINGVVPTGVGIKWLLKGYKKEEEIEFDSIAVQWLPLSRTQQQYTGVLGENA